jgi:amino-acid N-acetyltransferase
LALAEEAEKGNIDLKRLTDLINDSFRRELDLHHYMGRVDGRVAAVIIVGDYEGAAIVTWEGDKKVAYLDKLAVHSSSQGSSGIADIVFTEMIDMFPDELLWRSRATNPVNKWYFDRSKGTMRVPESHWIMFWAGKHTREATILQDYLQICQSIEPSFK